MGVGCRGSCEKYGVPVKKRELGLADIDIF